MPRSIPEMIREDFKCDDIAKCLQNLMVCGLVHRETRTISAGGYYYEYVALEPQRMKDMVQGNIDAWYNKMKLLVVDIDKEIMK